MGKNMFRPGLVLVFVLMIVLLGTIVRATGVGFSLSSEQALLPATPPSTPRPHRARAPQPSPTPVPVVPTSAPAATPEPAWWLRQLTAKLKGSGASFLNVLYQDWIQSYKATAPQRAITYQGVGSGQGISDVIKNPTDSDGTDAALSQERIQALADFLYWGLTEAQATAAKLGYAPLPDEAPALAITQLTKIQVNAQQVFSIRRDDLLWKAENCI